MSYRRNQQPVGGRRSTGSMNCGGATPTPTPFMFGGSYPGSAQNNNNQSFYSASATSFGNHASVRDCLNWPASLSASTNTGSNYSSSYASQGYNAYNASAYSQQRGTASNQSTPTFTYPQPKAYMQYPGMGDGKSQPIQIPCRLGPSGAPIAPLSTPEPLTIKVTAPIGAGQDGNPIAIKLDPSQFMGMANVKTYPSGRGY